MVYQYPVLPLDQNQNPIPALRPREGGATTEASVNNTGITIDLLEGTQVVSIVCLLNVGRYQPGDDTLLPAEALHYIDEGERLTFAVSKKDTKIALRADAGDVTFEITELT